MGSMFNNDFSREIFEQTYSFNGTETIHHAHERVASAIAGVESDKDAWKDKFK